MNKETTLFIIDILGHLGLSIILLYFYLYIMREKINKREYHAQQLQVRLIPQSPRVILNESANIRVSRQE